MYAKLSILALCAASSMQEVAAASLHRHHHLHPKRDIAYVATDVEVITDYVTVTVFEGEEPTSAPAPSSAAPSSSVDAQAKIADYSEQSAPEVSSTSSTPIVVPTTSSTTPVAAVESTSVPVASPTTLATAVKISAAINLGGDLPTTTESSSISSRAAADTPTNAVKIADASSLTSSAAAAATSAATSAAASSSGSKRGAAYNDVNLVETLIGMSKDISWAYNWGSSSGGLDSKVDYCPMLWSSAADHSSDWDEKASAAIASGSNCLLSFNEPDFPSQANMSPEDAATAHIQYMNTYAGQARIGSPAISSTQSDTQGVKWLANFFTACNGKCQVDFCAAHWYGPGGSDGADLFLQHVKDVYTTCQNKPVWITEFAAESGDVDQFMSTVVEKLESDEYSFVERYSYFMAKEGSLFESSTTLSSFGKIFAGVS
ncbi:glycosyl hydrolase catalytic core-domain-containing protein [Whalleya microplaca]|nr:glycosyl hydrolase catalytic core-domain-containing protein [Whalleya microplaca]